MVKFRSNENNIIQENMGLVVAMAKSFQPHQSELDDYIQVGSIGLLSAIRKYNPKLGALSTIAVPSIRWEIIKYANKQKKHVHTVSLQDVADIEAPLDKTLQLWEIENDTLTYNERTIIRMRSYGMTFKEISDIINIPRNLISVSYYESIAKIKEINI